MIDTLQLTKSFSGRNVVDQVSFAVTRGEIFGLIGPNGAGKSTLIKMLATLVPPTSGEARVAGFDLKRDPRRVRGHIGYVPQLLSADGDLTGYENLLLSARLYLVPRSERATRIEETLEMTGLKNAARRLAKQYSGGMLRRLEIAQSTLHRPTLLIMDEPTVGLDPVARETVWDHVRGLRQRFGTTVLMTTHVMEEVEALCGRVGILHQGRLEKVGAPTALKAEIGPNATLNDVFAHIAGTDLDCVGNYHDAGIARRSENEHV